MDKPSNKYHGLTKRCRGTRPENEASYNGVDRSFTDKFLWCPKPFWPRMLLCTMYNWCWSDLDLIYPHQCRLCWYKPDQLCYKQFESCLEDEKMIIFQFPEDYSRLVCMGKVTWGKLWLNLKCSTYSMMKSFCGCLVCTELEGSVIQFERAEIFRTFLGKNKYNNNWSFCRKDRYWFKLLVNLVPEPNPN